MSHEFAMLINGQAVFGDAAFNVVNPATGEPFAKCPRANEKLLNDAVAAAKAAFPAWAATSIEDRARAINRLADALQARIPEFANLLTQEHGKPLDQAMFELGGAVGCLRLFAGMRPQERVIREMGPKRTVEHRTPLGVVAAIMPWNFPLILMMTKLAPALVVGNTVVAKPAPTTPLTTLLFGEICREVLPRGVINFICDENDLGSLLTSHPDVAKVAFTGSTATGKKVMQSVASTVKRLTLELGGNDAALILDDVDPVLVARQVFEGAMSNAGQICFAVKRVYVPETLYEPFCAELSRLAKAAVVGDGAKPGTQVGPVQNRMQFEKLKVFLAEAREKGKVIAGGEVLDRPGYFIPPTIVRDIPDDSRLVREEQFGPILPVLKYRDVEDALARVNDSEYGLCGSVWGADVARATAVARRVESGTVWVNHCLGIDPTITVRGAKQSGIGAEMGPECLEEYTQAHIVTSMPLGVEEVPVRLEPNAGKKSIKVKAAVAREYGGALSIEEVELAEPRPDEILVRLVATGICHTDLTAMQVPGFVKMPIVLGHEGAGIVERVGAAVTKVAAGDHVVMTFDSCGVCPSCIDNHETYCHQVMPLNFGGMRPDGTTPISKDGTPIHGHFFGQSSLASFAICGERNVVKVRRDAPLELLGPLGCGIQTGAGAVINVLKPGPGRSIAVFGTGAVGIAAVMAARLLGASRIIGIDVVPHRLELARALGATDTIDSSKENPVEAIMRLTGHGVDFSFNTTALPAVFDQSVRCLAPRGTCGFVTTGGQNLPIDPAQLMLGRSIRGILLGDSHPDSFIPALIDLFLQGRFPIDRLVKFYPFERVNEAIHDAATGATIKPILRH